MGKIRIKPEAKAEARKRMTGAVIDSSSVGSGMDPEMEATLRGDISRREKVKAATGGGKASSSGNWFSRLFGGGKK